MLRSKCDLGPYSAAAAPDGETCACGPREVAVGVPLRQPVPTEAVNHLSPFPGPALRNDRNSKHNMMEKHLVDRFKESYKKNLEGKGMKIWKC